MTIDFIDTLMCRSLLEELSEFTNKSKDQEEDKEMETAPSQSSKGYIQDRQVSSKPHNTLIIQTTQVSLSPRTHV